MATPLFLYFLLPTPYFLLPYSLLPTPAYTAHKVHV